MTRTTTPKVNSVTAVNDTILNVKWTAVNGAKKYIVCRRKNDTEAKWSNFSRIAETTSTEYVDKGLEPDTEYFYGVIAVTETGVESGDPNDKGNPGTENIQAGTTLEKITITLNCSSLNRVVGETYAFAASVTPEALQSKDITWTSSDSSVVSIDDNGKIKALKIGAATVTASIVDMEKSASCTITVREADSLTLSTSQTIPNGVYRIRMSGTPYALTVQGDSDDKGANICIMQENAKALSQRFRFEYVTDGYYTVINAGSGLCLDDYGLGTEPGTNIDQWTPNGSASQLWQPVQNGNAYYLTPKCAPNLVADVEYGVKADGTNVSLWIPKGGTNQLFELIPVKTEMDEPDFVLPAGLTTIEEEAFEGLAMTVVRCPETLQEIGPRAFADCENLKEIYIPASTVTIAEDAFAGCGELTIWGNAGSAAEQFADAQGIAFETVS